ncbi:MAG: DNA repair protein RecO [Clostridia bacterium]|nr:DNA repair protein RecO [Clostridia bacterium]
MTCKVKGILLRIGQTVHEEKVLTILTERQGCITVFAKSSRKKTQYDQFYYGEWVLYETAGGNYLLNSFSLEEPFHELKDRMENTFLAGYFAQVVLFFAKGVPSETGVLLPLLLNGLYLLGRGKAPRLVKSVFELKTMQLMGYCPTLADCGHPGSLFNLEDGSILCETCGLSAKAVPITGSVMAALTHILNNIPAKAFGFTVPKQELVRLSKLTEAFMLYHLEVKASALDLWKTVYEDEE